MTNRTGVAVFTLKTLLLTLAVMSTCCLARASDDNWRWGFAGLVAGVSLSASDGFDTNDRLLSDSTRPGSGTFHESGTDGWNGPTGFYWSDMRAPLQWSYTHVGNTVLRTGESKTWTFYLWSDQPNPSGKAYVGLSDVWNPAADVEYTLTYVRAPLGTIVGQGFVPVGTSIDLRQASGVQWLIPAPELTDGRSGSMFQLTATLVPEPSSLLGFSALLVGLVGFTARRMKVVP